MRRLLDRGASVLLACVALETASLAGLIVWRALKPEFFPTRLSGRFAAIDEDYVRRFAAEEYDPVLGWDYRSERRTHSEDCRGRPWSAAYDPDGSRADSLPFESVVAASYGDSFTHASEVDDDETWQHELGRALGARVKNFGVGGYGALQALLKLQGHLAAGRVAPVSILGVYERNIDRVVNVYRPFLFPKTREALTFKPAVRCPRGDCRLIDNPLRELTTDVAALERLAESLREIDYWEPRKTPIELPWFLTVLRLGAEKLEQKRRGATLWSDPEGSAAMRFVIEEFRRSVLAAGSIPVVLLLPSMEYVERHGAPSYVAFRDELRARRPDIVVVDVMESDFDPARFNVEPYRCHASVYGNRVIARALARAIAEALGPAAGLDSALPSAVGWRR